MGEPLRVAARLLAELPPFLQFLASVQEGDLPPHRGSGRGLEAPDPAFWRTAADEALRDLRAEDPPPKDPESQRVRLKRLLQRAQTYRRAQQQLTAGDGHLEALLTSQIAAGSVSTPPGVTEVIGGLFFEDLKDSSAEDGEAALTSKTEVGRQVGAEETVVLCPVKGDEDLWSVYQLFADRLVLLFDQGKRVLVAGPQQVLSCLLYGILLRWWQLSHEGAAKYLQKLGRDPGEVPEHFRGRVSESLGANGSPCRPGEQPPPLAHSLRAHLRLLDESRKWKLPHAEPLLRATEALLARALRWEPHAHDATPPGVVCLAALRAVRLELMAVANKRYCSALRDLVSIGWRVASRTCVEEGLLLKPDPAVEEPYVLAEELVQELEHAVHFPKLLLVSIEGSRHVVLHETLAISPQVSYHVYAVVLGSQIMARSSSSISSIRGAAVTGDRGLLLPPHSATVVLVQERLASFGPWVPWSELLSACQKAAEVPSCLTEKTFQLKLMTFAQYESAKRSGQRSAWEEVEIINMAELPVEARASHLHRRLASELKIPSAWQLLLAPGDKGWRYLLPSARLIDHAVAPAAGSGPLVLVVSVLTETSTMLPRSSKAAEQETCPYLSFPWVPAISFAWAERQMISLDVVLLDARRTLASYAVRIARCLEEEVGPHAYCTAFAAYELQQSAAATEQAGAWQPLKMAAPVATQLQLLDPNDGSGTLQTPVIIWEAMPLAPSMTGRGLFAAHDVACLPDLTASKKQMPLERLTARKAEEKQQQSEGYAALLVLEERLLVAWIDDNGEGVTAVGTEARRRIEAMIARLKSMAPEQAPPGLREWPAEPAAQWSGRTWERICRGAAQAQAWATPPPDASEAEVARGLLWAEVCTLQEIVLSLDALRLLRHGHCVLEGLRRAGARRATKKGLEQAAHLGARLAEVAAAERAHYATVLQSDELNELFSEEVEDLPSECDSDIAGLHALVQTTNAELNALWASQRGALLRCESEQLWRAVRLRELALSAPFLLVKQAQATKVVDELTLEWLRQVQQGCYIVLQKSQIVCEATSAVVSPPECTEESIAKALEELVAKLDGARQSLDELLPGKGGEQRTAEEAEQVLNSCDMHTLSGNLLALALERQLEACAAPAPRRIAKGLQDMREGLHNLVPKAMLVRANYDLPVMEDSVATFAAESQRRGRKLRLLGRNPRRTPVAPGCGKAAAGPEGEAPGEEQLKAEAAAEATANALLRSEDRARAKKKQKKKPAKKAGQEAASPTEVAKAKLDVVAQKEGKGGKAADEADSPRGDRILAEGKASVEAERARDRSAEGKAVEPEEEAAPAGDVKAAAPVPEVKEEDVEVRLLLEKGPFETLGERKKARLLEIVKVTGARCTLEAYSQAVRLQGPRSAVAKAQKLVEELSVEWVQVAEPVWVVLLRSPGRHLARLQGDSQCSVVVDRNSPRIRVAGTLAQVEAAQAWLWRLHEDCDSMQVLLGPHVRAPERLAAEAEGGGGDVSVELKRQRGGGHMAQVRGLTQEVQRAVEVLRAAALQAAPPARQQARSSCAPAEKPAAPEQPSRPEKEPQQQPSCQLRFGEVDSGDLAPPPAASRASPSRPSAAPAAEARREAPRTPARGSKERPEGQTPAPVPRNKPSPREASEDDGALSLAECLARQFPSARIIVGAPDELLAAESQNPPGSAGRLEMQMKRLKDLLDQDKARSFRHLQPP